MSRPISGKHYYHSVNRIEITKNRPGHTVTQNYLRVTDTEVIFFRCLVSNHTHVCICVFYRNKKGGVLLHVSLAVSTAIIYMRTIN